MIDVLYDMISRHIPRKASSKQCASKRASENDDLGKHGSLKGFSKSFSAKLSHSNWGS